MWGGLTAAFPPGVQPGQARGLFPEERGERASGQAAETEAAQRRHLPPRFPCARCPRQGPSHQGSPPPSQWPPAPLLAPTTVTVPSSIGAVTWHHRSSPSPGIALPPPHSQTEQKYFYKQRIFYVLPDRVRDAGREGPAGEWGVGAPLSRPPSLAGRRRFSPHRGLLQQGRAPPPFLSTELPQGETGTSSLSSSEALLLGGDTPQAVTL